MHQRVVVNLVGKPRSFDRDVDFRTLLTFGKIMLRAREHKAACFLLDKFQDKLRPFFDEVAQYSRRQQSSRLLDECFHQKRQDAGG